MKESAMHFRLEEIPVTIKQQPHNYPRPSECFIEVEFPKGSYLNYVGFKNFYTHSVTIKQFNGERWKCIVRNYKLMKNPHYEGDAQNWHLLKVDTVIY
jgi:hypothetical protein